ncbi:hypothetical protein FKW77_006409 [Venturia effusa]|uniref:Cysteine-rich secreted protein n=1 Tax=Venturia effusa TaxID=50376 RepID=A0A517LKE0_9PEZI|nr:hypothetical protein FKW77_006409 [Venturia effusa]
MKLTSSALLRVLALYFGASNVAAVMHYDWENIEVGEIDENTRIGTEIFFKQRPGSRVETPLRCDKTQGYQLVFSADKKFVACCLPGQKLVGSKDTAFDCCGEGHDLSGDKTVGFTCCPTGQKYDGKVCKPCHPPTPPVCENGKVLKDGMCVCPTDSYERDGVCVPTRNPDPPRPAPPPPSKECSSGIEAGKCYTWTFPNGERFGYNAHGWYTASKESRHQQFGKFKLCKDKECRPGPINPGEGFSAQDLHGNANGGQNSGWYIDAKTNGGHVGKTPDYEKSGRFTLTKWPCGKYCLGGFNAGFGPTCPSDLPAGTFTTHDKQSCIPIDVLEVPCDIHNIANNCIWHNGADQCCDKTDCSAAALARSPQASAGDGAGTPYKSEL